MIVRWLGCVEYLAAWRLQDELAELRAAGAIDDVLLLLEHPPTLTKGRATDRRNLIASAEQLARMGVALHEVDRGGDITYHGPGQLVGYPIVDLSRHGKDLHWYLREIEGGLIELLAGIGLAGRRFPPHTGVWIEDRKIAAIGVKVKRWVSTHGFALNVAPNMSHFDLIVPCGIREYEVTAICKERSSAVTTPELLLPCSEAMRSRFGSQGLQGQREGVLLTASSQYIWDQGHSM